MKSKGCIKANPDHREEFLSVVIRNLARNQTRLAAWLTEAIDLSMIDFLPIGGNSPFPGSNSELGGFGILIDCDTIDREESMEILMNICCEALHMEVEFKGSVQLAIYDNFEYIFFGDEISLGMLKTLQANEVIDSYELFDT